MAEPKPIASLSSSLLARKGAARPAMRRQGHVENTGHNAGHHYDLGWNDMGYDVDPSFEAKSFDGNVRVSPVLSGAIPEVVRQQSELAEKLAEIEHVEPAAAVVVPEEPVAPTVTLSPLLARKPHAIVAAKPATETGKRAAFTLRVDPARHLKLRLACALSNRSAQQIVTEALDNFLATLPEIDDLAGRVPANPKR